jgi:hypothetical protein
MHSPHYMVLVHPGNQCLPHAAPPASASSPKDDHGQIISERTVPTERSHLLDQSVDVSGWVRVHGRLKQMKSTFASQQATL